MMFWIIASLLVAVVALPLLRALSGPQQQNDAVAEDVAYYEAQTVEIDRQVASGMLTEDEAKAARTEAARKLLVLARQVSPESGTATGSALWARLAIMAAIPLVAVPIYLKIGTPGAPDLPYVARQDIDRSDADMRRLIARLDAHLAESPGDVRGWELALPVYMRLRRYEDAVVAAGRLLELRGETAERMTTLAEAMIYRNKGEADQDALKLLSRALELDPKAARTRFYLALGKEQQGDVPGALAALQALARDVTEPSEKDAVAAHIARLSKAGEQNATADALQALPDAERQQAISGMVEGLATRLKASGGSPEEWLRLVRAFVVLGNRERALAALADARTALSGNETALVALTRLANDLSLKEGPKP